MPLHLRILTGLALGSFFANIFCRRRAVRRAEDFFHTMNEENITEMAEIYRQHSHRMDPDIRAWMQAELRRFGIYV